MTKARDLGDNAQNTKPKVVDAKGDLIVGTGSDAADRLAAGSNGDTLLADSAASQGLRWQPTLVAGRNFIINGAFDFWQRGTSNTSGVGEYLADRWLAQNSSAATISRQSTGAPNGSRYVLRVASTGSGQFANMGQLIETSNVQLLWGSTVTLSVKVRKNASFTRNIEIFIQKSSTVDAGNSASWTTITSKSIANASLPTGTGVTDWFSDYITAAIPNDGTANTLRIIVVQSDTFTATGQYWEMANVQLEIGSVPTTFSRAGGTIAGELALCQRYYWKTEGSATSNFWGVGLAASTTIVDFYLNAPTTMRTFPSSIAVNNVDFLFGGNRYNTGTYALQTSTTNGINIRYTHGTAVFTSGAGVFVYGAAAGTPSIAASAEL